MDKIANACSEWFPIFSMFPCMKFILFPITFINSFLKLPVHCIYILKEWKCFLPIYVGKHISSQFKAQNNKCCLSSLSNFWQGWFIGTEWMYTFAKKEANAKSRSLQKYKENMAQGKRFLTRNLTDMYALTLTLDILDSR